MNYTMVEIIMNIRMKIDEI